MAWKIYKALLFIVFVAIFFNVSATTQIAMLCFVLLALIWEIFNMVQRVTAKVEAIERSINLLHAGRSQYDSFDE